MCSETEYACPNCSGVEMSLDPSSRRVDCADCGLVYYEESLIQWQITGEPPKPIE